MQICNQFLLCFSYDIVLFTLSRDCRLVCLQNFCDFCTAFIFCHILLQQFSFISSHFFLQTPLSEDEIFRFRSFFRQSLLIYIHSREGNGSIRQRNLIFSAHNYHSFHYVAQFPHISAITASCKEFQSVIAKNLLGMIFFIIQIQEVIQERHNIFSTFIQSGNDNINDIKSIIKIFPKCLLST